MAIKGSKFQIGAAGCKGIMDSRTCVGGEDVDKGQSEFSWMGLQENCRVGAREREAEWHKHGGIRIRIYHQDDKSKSV